MNSGDAGKVRSGAVGTLLGGFFQVARNQEKTQVRNSVQKKVENHIIERDTVILKTERQVRDFGQKALDWYDNS